MQPFFCIIEISGGLIASYVLDGIAKNRQDHFAAPKAAENPLKGYFHCENMGGD